MRGCDASSRSAAPRRFPVFGIDAHGSFGGSGAPFCKSSIECLSGERANAITAVARRAVDGHAGLHQPLAQRIDVVDLVGEVTEMARVAVRDR